MGRDTSPVLTKYYLCLTMSHRRHEALRLRAQLTVTYYRTDITDFRITPRRVPAVDKVAMDPSAHGQGLGKEHGVCKELQGRAELQRKAVARWLLL